MRKLIVLAFALLLSTPSFAHPPAPPPAPAPAPAAALIAGSVLPVVIAAAFLLWFVVEHARAEDTK